MSIYWQLNLRLLVQVRDCLAHIIGGLSLLHQANMYNISLTYIMETFRVPNKIFEEINAFSQEVLVEYK